MIVVLKLFQYALLTILAVVIGAILMVLTGIIWIFMMAHKHRREVVGRQERFN